MRSHREMYPEQYVHPLVGKLVETPEGKRGVVQRVFTTRFGVAAAVDCDPPTLAWPVALLREVANHPQLL